MSLSLCRHSVHLLGDCRHSVHRHSVQRHSVHAIASTAIVSSAIVSTAIVSTAIASTAIVSYTHMSLSVIMHFQKQTHQINENYCSGMYGDLAQKNYYHDGLINDRKILVCKNSVNNTLRVKKTSFLETGIKIY